MLMTIDATEGWAAYKQFLGNLTAVTASDATGLGQILARGFGDSFTELMDTVLGERLQRLAPARLGRRARARCVHLQPVAAACSGPTRSLIPAAPDHRFRRHSITDSGALDHPGGTAKAPSRGGVGRELRAGSQDTPR